MRENLTDKIKSRVELAAKLLKHENGTPQSPDVPLCDKCAMLMVRMVGIEPTLLAEPDSKSGASASSATPAIPKEFS